MFQQPARQSGYDLLDLNQEEEALQALKLLERLEELGRECVDLVNILSDGVFPSFAEYCELFDQVREFRTFADIVETKFAKLALDSDGEVRREINRLSLKILHGGSCVALRYLARLRSRGIVYFFSAEILENQLDYFARLRRDFKHLYPASDMSSQTFEVIEELLQILHDRIDAAANVSDFAGASVDGQGPSLLLTDLAERKAREARELAIAQAQRLSAQPQTGTELQASAAA